MAAPDLSGLTLPPVFPPAGTYRSCTVHGGLLHTAGHIPLGADGTLVIGRLGGAPQAGAGRTSKSAGSGSRVQPQ